MDDLTERCGDKPEAVDAALDASREALSAYERRFAVRERGGRLFGPIDTEMEELRRALKRLTKAASETPHEDAPAE